MADDSMIRQLAERIGRLPGDKRAALEKFLARLEQAATTPVPVPTLAERDWPHAPLHRLGEHGTYIVTAGTLYKQHHFRTARRLDLLEGKLLELARHYGWQVEAWAVFSNHYHFVAHSEEGSTALNVFLGHLHTATADQVNEWDGAAGRKVWYNFRETQLTYERSYLARLNYVHHNAVRHGLVRVANQYRWCSAAWLERTATAAQVKTIYSFKTDKVHIMDDFDVLPPEE